MKELYINQYEDLFDINGQGIIVNYVTLEINRTKLPDKYKLIEVFSEDLEKKVKELEKKLREFEKLDDDVAVFTLIPSYNCNMLCTYCFEGRQKLRVVEGYDNLDDFVRLLKQKYHYTKCEIILLGGEPVQAEILPVFNEYIGVLKKAFQVATASAVIFLFNNIPADWSCPQHGNRVFCGI